jgi:hypothetical protein
MFGEIHQGIRVGRAAMWGGLILSALLLSACVSIDIVSPEDPLTAIPDHSSTIHPGQTNRAGVRDVLGEPLFSSTQWRFDLFRESAVQTMVPIVLTPLPVPFGRMKDDLLRYTLVSYDDAGRAAALATGIFSKPSEFRRISPIEHDYSALHLRTGELMFFVDPEGKRRENLLIAPSGQDALLRNVRSPSACAVVMGCGDRGCGDRLAVDGGPARPLPLRIVQLYWLKADARESWLAGTSSSGTGPLAWLETLVAMQLPPGVHTLKFSSRHLGGECEVSLACRPGEINYLVLNATDNARFFNHALMDWQVDFLDAMPDRFARRPLVLLYEGQWFLGAENPPGVSSTQ